MLSSCCKLSRCVSKALPGQAGAASCTVLGRCQWPQPFVASPAVAAGCSCSPKPPLNLLGKPPAPAAAAGALGYFRGVMEFLLQHRAASTGNKRVDTTNTAARRRWWGCLMPTSVGVFFPPDLLSFPWQALRVSRCPQASQLCFASTLRCLSFAEPIFVM